MANYKVIQDIEAEDKFVGPLTLRQFIFAFIGAGMGYGMFLCIQHGVWFVSLIMLPFFAFCVFFAWPFGKDQPTEVWALAKLRFLFKPRRRIWDQAGMKELVTVTAPKKMERHLTDGLSQTEVRSRLSALASTLDSRGWAVKNVNVNLFAQPSYLASMGGGSDRLIDAASLPQEVPSYDVYATDDILDAKNNPTAQQLDTMIAQSEQTHRQALVATVQGKPPAQPTPASPQATADYWFMNQPTQAAAVPAGYSTFANTPTVMPGADDNLPVSDTGEAEQALLKQIHEEQKRPQPGKGHMRVIDPNGPKHADNVSAKAPEPPTQQKSEAVTTPPNPDILRLANNDDLNVATIAREAHKSKPKSGSLDSDDGEVVISLR